MADWPLLLDSGPIRSSGANAANSKGTTVTAAATINTKGAWTVLDAATSRDSTGILLMVNAANATISHLLDIGVGAASAEHVLIPDILIAHQNTIASHIWFPLAIPAGTRVVARTAASTASAVNYVMASFTSQGFAAASPPTKMITYGAVAATSRGTSVDPGATINTKGAYTEITASTTRPIRALGVSIGHQINTTRTNADQLVDIAVGAAAAEYVIIPNLFIRQNTACFVPPFIGTIPVTIPQGSRLAVRAQSSIIDAADRLFDIVLHGVT